MLHDLRYALRTLGRSPGFTTLAVVSLALGIGANTAVFSLLHQVSLRALPVSDPSSLVILESEGPNYGITRADNRMTVFSYPLYVALRDGNTVFSGLIARSSAPATMSWGGEAVRATAEMVTGNYFAVLGVEPALGRLITPDDEARREPVAVLGHSYWAGRLGSDPNVLNSRVLVNGRPVLVVGVAGRGFKSVLSGQTPDLYVPASLLPLLWSGWRWTEQVDAYWVNVFGRLRPGVTAARANAALLPAFRAVLESHLERMSDASEEVRKNYRTRPLKLIPAAQGINELRSQWQAALIVLMAMVALVLLIACANLAGLMLVRTAARQRETALRFALGASRWQAARQPLMESLIVAMAGGLAGLFICDVLMEGLLKILPEEVAGGWLGANTDFRLFAFSLALGAATGLLFGLIPAVRGVGRDLAPALKEHTSGLTSGEHRSTSRRIFVAAQVCLSFLLLVVAGLFTHSLVNLVSSDPGFRVERLVTFSVEPGLNGYSQSRSLSLYRELEGRLKALPAVESTARAFAAQFSGYTCTNGVKAPGTRQAADTYADCQFNAVSPGYFRTMGIPLLAGREFSEQDAEKAPKVAVLNETFARFLFEGREAVGRFVILGSSETRIEIVGVVKDSRYGDVREGARRFIYVPYEQAEAEVVRRSAFFLRTRADERQVMATVRKVVKETAPAVPVERVTSMNMLLGRSIYRERLLSSLAVGFGVLATVLAAVGLYGATSYSTARRRREFGIRLAMGADPGSLLALIVREAAWLVAAGLCAGLPLSYAAAGVLRSQLFGVAPHDPKTFTAAALLIALVTFCAALVPGLRAMGTDPVEALRDE